MAIEDAVIQAVAKKFEKDESEVTRETALKELGGDDLDRMELIQAMEEQFNISIPQEAADNLQTVGDLIEAVERLTGG